MRKPDALDEFDRRILRTLQADPTITMQALATAVGLSQTPCWRRVKALEEAGVIAGRAVLLDPKKVGFTIDVFARVKIGTHDEDNLEAFEAAVARYPEIVECFMLSGDNDYLMRIIMPGIEDYERFLKRVLLHLPGVTGVNSSFAMKSVKLTTVVPV